jgi:2-haloacid dehalogenase
VVAIARDLHASGIRTFGLTNWSARTFAIARRRFTFLDEFDGIVVSGEVGVAKPDARIYRALLGRFRLAPAETLFIDDRRANVESAARLGIRGVVFVDPVTLRHDLAALGLPVGAGGRAEPE